MIFILVLLALVVAFCYWYVRADADLTLLWYERYGSPISVLKGEVVWITGATSGIGEYLAYCLAENGVRLALSGRDEARLEKVVNACRARGTIRNEDILAVPFNITNYESHELALRKVLDRFGHVDILVNNAGRSQRAAFLDIESEVDHDLFHTNVFGPVALTRKVVPHMIERRKGHIVVSSSIAGKFGYPNSSTYIGTKHALQGYFEALHTEVRGYGIKITLVCPGPVHSRITENAATEKAGEVYGKPIDPADVRLATDRCAYQMAVAMANRLDEVWLSLQPMLLCCYLSQYMPSIYKRFISRLGGTLSFASKKKSS